jgi:hypothetical protein
MVARFARCAMLASELLDMRAEEDGAIAMFAPDALLGLGRIREVDLPRCALVRAHELYVELLPDSTRMPTGFSRELATCRSPRGSMAPWPSQRPG